jgi:hypothetical protein
MTHDLKTWAEYFNQVWEGNKNFEIRKDDRGFKINDILCLMEYFPHESTPEKEVYSERFIRARVDYILVGGQFGLQEGYIAMSISVIEKINKK